MRKTILISVLAATISTPVLAVDASMPTGVAGIPTLSRETTQAELDSQLITNAEARRVTYERLRSEGGCNADVLPVEFAAYCWSNAVSGSRDIPNGGPVGHSIGGSESASDGSTE